MIFPPLRLLEFPENKYRDKLIDDLKVKTQINTIELAR